LENHADGTFDRNILSAKVVSLFFIKL